MSKKAKRACMVDKMIHYHALSSSIIYPLQRKARERGEEEGEEKPLPPPPPRDSSAHWIENVLSGSQEALPGEMG